jgi:hypothetical protein
MKTNIYDNETTRAILLKKTVLLKKTGKKVKSHGSYRAKRKPNSKRVKTKRVKTHG